jgi:hypothetical protein
VILKQLKFIVLLMLIWVIAAEAQNHSKISQNIYVVQNTAILREVQRLAGREGSIDERLDVILVEPSYSSTELVVLVQGTEAFRLNQEQRSSLYSRFPEIRGSMQLVVQHQEALRSGVLGKMFDPSRMMEYGAWKEELYFGYKHDKMFSRILVDRNIINMGVSGSIANAMYYGLDLEFLWYKGAINDYYSQWNSSSPFGFKIFGGFPFVGARIAYTPYALPEFLWLEKDLNSKFGKYSQTLNASLVGGDYANHIAAVDSMRRETKSTKLFEAPRGETPASMANMTYTLMFKYGMLHYDLHMNFGWYKAPIHHIYLDGIPLLKGSWGLGVLATAGAFVPGGWIDFGSIPLMSTSFMGRSSLNWKPLVIKLYRGQASQFNFSIESQINFR